MLFGVFTGYLFYRSEENIWGVVAFHILLNVFSVIVPLIVTHSFEFTFYVAEIVTFLVMILLLWYLPLKKKL